MVETVTYTSYLKDNMGPALKKMGTVGKAAINKVDTTSKKLTATLRRGAAGVDHLRTRLNTLSGSSRMLGGLTRQLMGFASVFLLFQQGADSLRKFDEQAKSDMQIKAALTSTNYAAGRSFAQLATQADILQKKTLFGDEETQRAQALLLTFKQIRGEMFDQTIPVIQDVATAMKMDLKAASLQVGKALNDPATGLSMLTRVGITFSDEQKAVIKSLQKSGNMAGAQAIILKELKSEFEGSARAAALAGMGPFQQFANRIGDGKEGVGALIFALGKGLLPVLNSVATGIEKSIAWMIEHKAAMKAVAIIVGVAATAFIGAALATNIWTFATKTLWIAIKANPFGFIVAAIGAVVGAIIWAWNKFEGFRMFLFGLWDSFKAVFTNLKQLAFDVLGSIGELLIGVFTFDIDLIKSGFNKLKGGFKDYGSAIAKAYQDGAEKGAASFQASQEKKAQAKGSAVGGFGVDGNYVPPDPGGTGSMGLGLAGVSGGGKSCRSVTINLQSLIGENTNIINNVSDADADLSQFESMMRKTLLTLLNDANLIGN